MCLFNRRENKKEKTRTSGVCVLVSALMCSVLFASTDNITLITITIMIMLEDRKERKGCCRVEGVCVYAYV